MMGRPALLLGVLAIAGLGCVAATDDRGAEIEVARGRDGGPPSGTCATGDGDRCGGPGSGACWCDEVCTSYGDCCPDAGPVCGLDWPEPEPAPDPGPMPDPEPDPDDAAVPAGEHCEPVAEWDAPWIAFEAEVVALGNEARAAGADCGTKGVFGPAPALATDPALRCAARRHALDMDERDFFAHENPDGELPWDRMSAAGYAWSKAAENIAGGQSTPAQAIAGWLESDGHCANLMNPDLVHIGVAYFPGGPYDTSWVQNFGAPP